MKIFLNVKYQKSCIMSGTENMLLFCLCTVRRKKLKQNKTLYHYVESYFSEILPVFTHYLVSDPLAKPSAQVINYPGNLSSRFEICNRPVIQ